MKSDFFNILKLTLSITLLGVSQLLGASVTPATMKIQNSCNSSEIVVCQPNENSIKCGPDADNFSVETGSIPDNAGIAKLTFSPVKECYRYVCSLAKIFDESSVVVNPDTNYSCYISLKKGVVDRCELKCTPQ